MLIQNNGTDPIVGTFNGLPERRTDRSRHAAYYITYHYNAETGQFGTGNDVAICSSPFAVSATPLKALATTNYLSTREQRKDATYLLQAFCSECQLSPALWAAHDSAWASGTPSYSYITVATVDPDTGLVTFQPPSEGDGGPLECTILVTATEPGTPTQTFEVPVSGVCAEGYGYIPDGQPDALESHNRPVRGGAGPLQR